MHMIHLGGERTVTGSCHLMQVRGLNILVDCQATPPRALSATQKPSLSVSFTLPKVLQLS
jgi:Cft2 family RNA processing exonuclease